MTKIYSGIKYAITALIVLSCVDEYEDANPPLPLDAPYAYVSSSVTEGSTGIPVVGGDQVTFTYNIVDAPGTLSEVNFIFSKGGEVISHTFDAIAGQTSGTFEVTVKAPYNLDGQTTFTTEITDAQEEPKMLTINKVLDVAYLYDGPDFTVEIDDPDSVAFEGDVIDVIVTINDVPSGAIASISAAGSAGTVTFDQAELDALIGQSSGSITGTLEVGPVAASGGYTVTVAITDELQNRQVIESDGIVLVCPSAVDVSGTYDLIASGELGDDGGPYFNLASTVTITQINVGQYEIDDMSFGVYPVLYADTAPTGVLNVCGHEISGVAENEDQYGDPFTITGEIVEASEDVLKIEWSNTFGDSGTVTLVKQ